MSDAAADLAKQADDPDKIRKAVDDQASVVATLWVTFLGFAAYLAIIVGSVDSRQLFFDEPLNLPLVNVKVPLVVFAWLAPMLLVVFQVYLAWAVKLLEERVDRFDELLAATADDGAANAHLLRQLPGSIFVQWLADLGSRRWIPRVVAWLTVFVGPLSLLLLFEQRYLPLQDRALTNWQIALFVINLLLLWVIWRNNAEFIAGPRGQRLRRAAEVGLFVIVAFAAAVSIARIFPNYLNLAGESLVNVAEVTTARDARTAGQLLRDRLPVHEVHNRNLSHAIFDGADLRMVAFVNVDLTDASFKNATLSGARFECAATTDGKSPGKCSKLTSSVMSGATLDEARIARYVDARGAHFEGVSAVQADFSGADLTDAKFGIDSNGPGAADSPASLQCPHLHTALPSGAIFSGADLRASRFDGATLNGAIFSGADLCGSSFRLAKGKGAHFKYAYLDGSIFQDATLWAANFDLAVLAGANMSNAKLWAAELTRADLTDVDLSGADLYGANFYQAHLHHVVLQSASVWQMDLGGANVDLSWLPGNDHGDPTTLLTNSFPYGPLDEVKNKLTQAICDEETLKAAIGFVDRLKPRLLVAPSWHWGSQLRVPFLPSRSDFHKARVTVRLATLSCADTDLFEGLLLNNLIQHTGTHQQELLDLMSTPSCTAVTKAQVGRLESQLARPPSAAVLEPTAPACPALSR